jgi:hypothetical protein
MEPKNLISENLFSKGTLFLDNKVYTGPYNIKADGSYYSLKNKQIISGVIVPTQEDYEKGSYTRYFIKRKGTKNIVEVGEDELNNVGSTISEVLFKGFQLDWKISGILNDKYDSKGTRQESGVRDTNRRTLQRLEQDFLGISDKLKNLTQFYRNI